MTSDTLRARAGTTLVEDFQLTYPADHPNYPGQNVTDVYTGSETLTLNVWRGSSQAPATLTTSAATWYDAANGIIKITIVAADTTALGAGLWRVTATVTTGTAVVDLFDPPLGLTITDAPGAATDLPTYCSYADVLVEAPWVRELVSVDSSLSSDLEEFRAAARVEFDQILVNHYRGETYDNVQTNLDHLLDSSPRRSALESSTLVAWLDANRLVLTGPTGKRAKRWNALMAAYMVGKSQISTEGQTPYQEYARRCHAEARAILGTLAVGIDTTTPADGVADIVIDLAAHDTLRG